MAGLGRMDTVPEQEFINVVTDEGTDCGAQTGGRHILEIEFVNGAIYRYFDIPLSVHRDLMSAESKARFYDSNIRKHYRSVLVRPRQKEQAANGQPITQKGLSH